MKSFILSSLLLLLSLSVSAGTYKPSELPDCKDVRGSILTAKVDELKVIMRTGGSRPQVFATGVITKILPEDRQGSPHQKYTIKVDDKLQLLIISNLVFGRIPLAIGKTVSICGEYKNVAKGMIHWTHFDPRGTHPDGFTIMDGVLYGDTEITQENRY